MYMKCFTLFAAFILKNLTKKTIMYMQLIKWFLKKIKIKHFKEK